MCIIIGDIPKFIGHCLIPLYPWMQPFIFIDQSWFLQMMHNLLFSSSAATLSTKSVRLSVSLFVDLAAALLASRTYVIEGVGKVGK